MEYIYIISIKRGQAGHEIAGFYTDYDEALMEFHRIEKRDADDIDWISDRDREYFSWELYKFPTNESFLELDRTYPSSDTKIEKSSKYRVKFYTRGELIDEYNRVSRNVKIKEIIQ